MVKIQVFCDVTPYLWVFSDVLKDQSAFSLGQAGSMDPEGEDTMNL
jgi:hypothetical protein